MGIAVPPPPTRALPTSVGIWRLAVLLLSAVPVAGCGSDQVPRYPVSGKVLYQGKPAPYATVRFHPRNASDELKTLCPRGTTALDGTFELSTYGLNDGAPEGEYKVTVSWQVPEGKIDPAELDPDVMQDSPERLPKKYTHPKSTPIRVTITSDTRELDTFKLP